jgi:hypothetical protein
MKRARASPSSTLQTDEVFFDPTARRPPPNFLIRLLFVERPEFLQSTQIAKYLTHGIRNSVWLTTNGTVVRMATLDDDDVLHMRQLARYFFAADEKKGLIRTTEAMPFCV